MSCSWISSEPFRIWVLRGLSGSSTADVRMFDERSSSGIIPASRLRLMYQRVAPARIVAVTTPTKAMMSPSVKTGFVCSR